MKFSRLDLVDLVVTNQKVVLKEGPKTPEVGDLILNWQSNHLYVMLREIDPKSVHEKRVELFCLTTGASFVVASPLNSDMRILRRATVQVEAP
jgi:hypothetical protein